MYVTAGKQPLPACCHSTFSICVALHHGVKHSWCAFAVHLSLVSTVRTQDCEQHIAIRTSAAAECCACPVAGQPTICLHTGMTDAYVWDLETPEPRIAGRAETQQILEEIDTVFRRQVTHLVYSHKVSIADLVSVVS